MTARASPHAGPLPGPLGRSHRAAGKRWERREGEGEPPPVTGMRKAKCANVQDFVVTAKRHGTRSTDAESAKARGADISGDGGL